MCKFSSKSGGVPFQPLGDLTWNDPILEGTIGSCSSLNQRRDCSVECTSSVRE